MSLSWWLTFILSVVPDSKPDRFRIKQKLHVPFTHGAEYTKQNTVTYIFMI